MPSSSRGRRCAETELADEEQMVCGRTKGYEENGIAFHPRNMIAGEVDAI
jgi:hypothetical protein